MCGVFICQVSQVCQLGPGVGGRRREIKGNKDGNEKSGVDGNRKVGRERKMKGEGGENKGEEGRREGK